MDGLRKVPRNLAVSAEGRGKDFGMLAEWRPPQPCDSRDLSIERFPLFGRMLSFWQCRQFHHPQFRHAAQHKPCSVGRERLCTSRVGKLNAVDDLAGVNVQDVEQIVAAEVAAEVNGFPVCRALGDAESLRAVPFGKVELLPFFDSC
jgi:hypothetical protein